MEDDDGYDFEKKFADADKERDPANTLKSASEIHFN